MPSSSPEKYDLESRQNTRTTSCSCFFFSAHFHTSSPTHQTHHPFIHHSVPSRVTKRTSPFSHPQNRRVASGLKSMQRTVPLLQVKEAVFTSFRSLYVCLILIAVEMHRTFQWYHWHSKLQSSHQLWRLQCPTPAHYGMYEWIYIILAYKLYRRNIHENKPQIIKVWRRGRT